MAEQTVLRERILTVYENLSPKQRLLAQFFLDNEPVVAFSSTSEIAGRVGTSAATVVRFSRELGFDGYAELQRSVQNRLPVYRTVVQKMADQFGVDGTPDQLREHVARANVRNVQETLGQVSAESLSSTVSAIIAAERIHIFGSGLVAAAAVLTEHTLNTLGFAARAFTDEGVTQMLELAHLSERDLVIVISIWRYLRSSVTAAQVARNFRATSVALTDSPVAPVVNLVDHSFIAATEGAAHSRSLAGILSLIELLGAALARERPEQSMKTVQRIDQLYRENGLLVSD